MTFKKLLASAGAVALLTGGAHAATLTDLTPVCAADEIDFTTAKTGNIVLVVTADGTEFQVGQEVQLNVSLSGATIEDLASGGLVAAGGGFAISTPTVTGGASGSTTAAMNFTVTGASAATNTLTLTLPVEATASSNISATLDAATLLGTPILASDTTAAVIAVDGVSASLAAADPATVDKIDPSDPTEFSGGLTTPLGALTVSLNTYDAADCSADAAGAVASSTVLASTPLAIGDVDLVLTATSEAAQIADLTYDFDAGTTDGPADLGDALTLSAGATDGANPFTLTTAGDEDIAVSAINAVATVEHPALTDISVASTAVTPLEFDGEAALEEFPWFAMSSTTANSIIRCTADAGFSAGVAVDVTVNNSTDVTDATYTLASAPATGDTEFVISSADVAAATSSTGRADIDQINFVGQSTGVECARLLVNTTTGTVTPFGNQGN